MLRLLFLFETHRWYVVLCMLAVLSGFHWWHLCQVWGAFPAAFQSQSSMLLWGHFIRTASVSLTSDAIVRSEAPDYYCNLFSVALSILLIHQKQFSFFIFLGCGTLIQTCWEMQPRGFQSSPVIMSFYICVHPVKLSWKTQMHFILVLWTQIFLHLSVITCKGSFRSLCFSLGPFCWIFLCLVIILWMKNDSGLRWNIMLQA